MARKSARKPRPVARKGVSDENLSLFPPKLSFQEFVSKWKSSTLSERAGSHSHFIDLCLAVGQETPTDIDCEGSIYTFEKEVEKNCGGDGFADVWKDGFFAWEYKRKGKSLADAYQQLLKYREALNNPPLLVVCDFDRFEVHTNWTNTSPQVYKFDLQDILLNKKTESCSIPPRDVLYSLFAEPEKLKPGETSAQVTKKAAVEFAKLAESLRSRNVSADDVAHYIMRLLFCLFAEDIHLLKRRPFRSSVENNRRQPAKFVNKLRDLFNKMAHGGFFGPDDIPYFDGGLFMDDKVHALTIDDLNILSRAAQLNWAAIEPAIFGTLFERVLDPSKGKLGVGARYTSVEDIELIVEPVLMKPLRREWQEVQQTVDQLIQRASLHKTAAKAKRLMKAAEERLREFINRLSGVRILDPACGSGNFLYVALKHLLALEKEVSIFAWDKGISGFFTQCHPSQLYGIESNVYAHKVASVAVWIGYLQWHQQGGMPIRDNPVMQQLENIRRMDAVLAYDERNAPLEPKWPQVDVIVGNPPFLGDKKMRAELKDKYVEDLRSLYSARVSGGADYVTYWFERARAELTSGNAKRVGLLATNSIRMVGNRKILERIKQAGDIFMAWSDRPWILDGANVRVSLIGFDAGDETTRTLDGKSVTSINADLTAGEDVSTARALRENSNLCFLGMMKGGPFDIDAKTAKAMLAMPINPNGRPNSDVVKPRLGGMDIMRTHRDTWIIDFGTNQSQEEAALYERPFEYVRTHVKPIRDKNRRKRTRERWWIHAEARPGLRRAIANLNRCIVTPEVAKHRVFRWMSTEVVPDHKLHVIARADDYFLGVLQSRLHTAWARRLGSTLEDRPSYNSETVFSSFPFPWPPNVEPKHNAKIEKIAKAARELVEKRDRWLNSVGADTEKRTLTKLYNENPTWLQHAHRELDEAVLAGYGWPKDLSDEEMLSRLLRLNKGRFASQSQPEVPYQRAEPERPTKKSPVSVGRSGVTKRVLRTR